MSILTLMISFKITGVLLAKFLQIIELHCPKPNNCLKTLYKFNKFFKNLKTPLKKHFFCSECFCRVNKPTQICPNCKVNENITYFIEIPIIAQLKAIFKRPNFYETISTYRFSRKKVCHENLEDIYDGSVYKELESSGFLSSKNNISFTWNTDGFPIFKSSKFSIWPLYLQINELPYEQRIKKENVILAGIWFGKHKPRPNLFLCSFRESLKKLYKGVIFITNLKEKIKVRGLIICGTCDLQAKSLFLNMKLYSGYYGCLKCKIRGERIGNVQIYPFDKNIDLRTTSETLKLAKQVKGETDILGVKGKSVLSEIVYNYIETTTIDIMHCVHINVMKKLLSLWFDSEFHDKNFSLRQFLCDINKLLTSVCPIDHIPRIPRTLDDYSYWKASELKAFLLVYSLPILKNYMPEIYFDHHVLLVYAITLLSSTSISKAMIKNASSALSEYVKRYEILYGKNNMTNNIHLLLHLPKAVEQFGPLWTTSCYSFENLNGILKNYVHSSNRPELQIHAAISIYLNLSNLKDKILVENNYVTQFCSSIETRCKNRRKLSLLRNNLFMVGARYKEKNLETVKNIFGNIDVSKFHFFKRLMKDNIYYETKFYSLKNKKNSSCVKYTRNSKIQIGSIQYFLQICRNDCECKAAYCSNCDHNCRVYAIVLEYTFKPAFILTILGQETSIPNNYLCEHSEHESYVAVNVDNIQCTCYENPINDHIYATAPCNFKESE